MTEMSISQHIAGIRSRAGTQTRSLSGDPCGESMAPDRNTSIDPGGGDEGELARNMAKAKLGENHVDTAEARPFVSLDEINFNLDFGDKLQEATIEKLEQKWLELNTNLEGTLRNLQGSSHQVTESSKACLNSLKGSVETMCDKIDGELTAFFHLMTKCDELTTKLSIANSFRDEIKTLRKSVETLEQLYRK